MELNDRSNFESYSHTMYSSKAFDESISFIPNVIGRVTPIATTSNPYIMQIHDSAPILKLVTTPKNNKYYIQKMHNINMCSCGKYSEAEAIY